MLKNQIKYGVDVDTRSCYKEKAYCYDCYIYPNNKIFLYCIKLTDILGHFFPTNDDKNAHRASVHAA